MRGKRRIENRQILGFELLPGYHLCHAAPRLGRVRNAVSAISKRIDQRSRGIGPIDARHHVMADVNPPPPRVFDVNIAQWRELPIESLNQKLKMLGVRRVGTRDRAPATDLQAIVW